MNIISDCQAHYLDKILQGQQSLRTKVSPENRINEADFSKFITRNEDNNTVSLGPDGINWSQIDSNFLTIFLDC